MKKKAASVDRLNLIHDLLATYYKEILEAGIEGEMELSSGTLAALNTFLKNNEIVAALDESEPMKDLTAKFKELINKEKQYA